MVRATSAVARHRRRKRLMKQAKGFWGDRKNHIRQTSDAVVNALAANYRHRKERKREFRSLWITRLSVAAKLHGISYSKLMFGLKKIGCGMNRKVLSEMAIHHPEGFAAIVTQAKTGL